MNNSRQIKHLYARAGFGIRFEDLHQHENWSVKKAAKKLFEASVQIQNIKVVTENLDLRYHPNQSEDEKKAIQEERNKQEKALNNTWMQQMSTSDAQLREKMTLFWHNHFACNIGNSYYEQQLNNIERANALGNFKTMLIQVSQAPGMLQFLNNQQNVKNHPNENFARELMELFTMGRGNYTEQDIKESARAFTGWQYDGKTASFVFRPGVHDTGVKTFLGNQANFCGEDIIDIIIKNPVTAKYICTKLYRYLVNDIPDDGHISQMADLFYKNNYEITPLLEFVFTADWFYDDKNIGNLIKSPVEFLVGLNRQFYVNYQNPDVLMQFQRTLGQVLFRPPNVAGWPGGRSWIDSSSLMYRMKIPSTILSAGIIDFNGKPTPEDQAYLAATKRQQFNVIKRTLTVPDWDRFFQKIPLKTPHPEIAQFMLEPTMSARVLDEVNSAPDIKTMLIQVVSTPEYQLC
ncbi:uncharacterized protein (DUF1800 family) [Mucilaginibacter yixingensis]|uniref:Uncharacterized protein (DUF1800 family) n=1 Tax=Mucilaginibacter yixingensis TaxID=1295612 RepID=A0A2T5J5F4_9SPHI|nr:DUF1800 domain-containing protein [Mucilaginibacter yixingensis]PTQ93211.1 uncharacterized protein (DUF1800 family) [Mucilaginibacter yixingensis]